MAKYVKKLNVLGSDITIKDSGAIHVYATLSNLVASDAQLNDIVKTTGYASTDDGGGAYYQILETQPSSHYVTLNSGLYAKLLTGDMCNIRQYGAIGDGVHDDTLAIQQCVTDASAKNGVVYVPQGKYKLTGTIDLSNVTVQGTNIIDGTTPYENGSTFYITHYAGYAFSCGYNVTLTGVGFYYPDQIGASVNPIEYKATIGFTNTPNMLIENCVFYNSFIGISNSDLVNGACGKITITNCYAYCIDEFMHIKNAYDSVHIDNCFISAGVFQDVALTGNKYLATYTANNGKCFVLDVHVDDLKIDNTLVWGYRYGIISTNATVNMLKMSNVHFDAVITALYTENTAILYNTLMSNCEFFCINNNFSGETYGAIVCSGTGAGNLTINGCLFEGMDSHVVYIDNGITEFIFTNNNVHTFKNTALFFNCNSSLCVVSNNIFRSDNNTESYGVNIQLGVLCIVTDNIINGCYCAINLDNINNLILCNNQTVNSANASLNLGTIGKRKIYGNVFDIPVLPQSTEPLVFGTVAGNNFVTKTATYSGARVGDFISIVPTNSSLIASGIIFEGCVTTENTISITAKNYTAGAIELGNVAFYVNII